MDEAREEVCSAQADLLHGRRYLARPERDVAQHRSDGRQQLLLVLPADAGHGIGVAITGFVLLGVGGLFGADWERRQIDKYLERRGVEPGP
jgi:hypothetical protein